MYTPIDASDETIIMKAEKMTKSWVSGWVDGIHRHHLRNIIKQRGLDFDPRRIPISPSPEQVLPILRDAEKILICEERVESTDMWFRPLKDDQAFSLSFDYDFSPISYSVRQIIDETITLHYESLIIQFTDDWNNLIGFELINIMLFQANSRNIRFIWFKIELRDSDADEFKILSSVVKNVFLMPKIVKLIITGLPLDENSELLNSLKRMDKFRTQEEMKQKLK